MSDMGPNTKRLNLAKSRLHKSPLERFWNNVLITPFDSCWEWVGSKDTKGYGRMNVNRVNWKAHRLSYIISRGEIPDNLPLDHLCRNPGCVRPEHLEAVSLRENTLRGQTLPAANAKKTHCPQGHEFTEENTYKYRGTRSCVKCRQNSTKLHLSKRKNNLGL